MSTNSSDTPLVSTLVPAPVASPVLGVERPRPFLGRPSGFSEETVGRLCEVIRRRGMSDTAAARALGIPRQTLSRWKHEHAELEEWLAMAREQYREAKLGIVDEATTADGRPDWRAAAWALQKAFPEDYGRRPAGAGAPGFSPVAGLTWGEDCEEITRLINESCEAREEERVIGQAS